MTYGVIAVARSQEDCGKICECEILIVICWGRGIQFIKFQCTNLSRYLYLNLLFFLLLILFNILVAIINVIRSGTS
jgi:hypothetical protein